MIEKHDCIEFLAMLEEFTGYRVSGRAIDLAWDKFSFRTTENPTLEEIEAAVIQTNEAERLAESDLISD